MKIYNVNRKSDDEYINGLDSSWETIDLAHRAADLQNKHYSDILRAEVYEMELKTAGDWKEYERNIIENSNTLSIKVGTNSKESNQKNLLKRFYKMYKYCAKCENWLDKSLNRCVVCGTLLRSHAHNAPYRLYGANA